jgi:predicted sulfurtransferase
MDDDVKRCRNCGQVKRSQEFRRNARCRDGLSSWCAGCHVEATRAYRQRRREAEAEAAWRRRKAETEKLRRWEVERRARVEQRLRIRPRHTVN